MSNNKNKKILVIASGGGHYEEILRLRPVFHGYKITIVTTCFDRKEGFNANRSYVVNDATAWNRFGLAVLAVRMLLIVAKEKPKVVVSTGAAPGFFGIMFGKLFGSKTIWIDSIANMDSISHSGRLAKRFSDLYLTQWEYLAAAGGPEYGGSVL